VQLENNFTVAAPVDEAWKVLTDVERVAHCMPGATLDSVDGDEFTGRVKVKVGPIVVTYQGKASFVEKDEQEHRAVIDASGKESRGSGTAKATVTTALKERGEETEVSVLTDLNITGRPAQFGRGVIADVAGKLTDQFAKSLAEELVRSESGATPASEVSSANGSSEAATGTGVRDESAPNVPERSSGSDDDVIDLLGVSTAPILKRLLPLLAAVGLVAVVLLVRRSRRKGRG